MAATIEDRVALLEAQVFELQHRMDWSGEVTTQQGLRHASFRAISGTAGTYEGDARAAFEVEATIPAGATFNEAFILWLQARLSSADTNLQNLMQAFAEQEGATNWSSLGSFDPAVSYTANPVEYDGVNDYLTRGADLTGAVDDPKASGSLWFRRTGGDGVLTKLLDSAANRILVRFNITTNLLEVVLRGTDVLAKFQANVGNVSADSVWHHLMWSTNGTAGHIYLDDVAGTVTALVNANLDLTLTNWSIGANTAGGDKFTGDLADVQVWHGVYADLSVEANRRLFIGADGKPVDPATAAATLGSPIMLFEGPTDTWHTNDGTGGGFTENGALTDGTGPVEL